MKIRFTIKNCFMLLTIKNKIFLDYIFKLFSIVFICIVKNILKNIHINKIIKNKILYIKTIFKYFKIYIYFFKVKNISDFYFTKYQKQFFIFHNCFQKIVIKQINNLSISQTLIKKINNLFTMKKSFMS